MKSYSCPECGPTGSPHLSSKIDCLISFLIQKSVGPFSLIVSFFIKVFNKIGSAIFYKVIVFLVFSRVAKFRLSPLFQGDSDRIKCMWRAAKHRGIVVKGVEIFSKKTNLFLANLPDGKNIIFESLPRPEGEDHKSLEWIDDKGEMKKRFKKAGFPVPRGNACFTKSCAFKVFYSLRKNGRTVIVKPTMGSRSRHSRTHIKTEKELFEAFKIAKQISPFVSVEEEFTGAVYRVALIGGEIGGVIRRDPPYVVGNGKNTVLELVKMVNLDSRRSGPIFYKIPVNFEMDLALKRQFLNKNDIPEMGRMVFVGTKIGRDQGGVNADVTDEVHIENKRLFQNIGRFLKVGLVGIDFMIEDIKKPWRFQMPCGVIELNSLPFLDLHHYPFEGKVRDVSGMLWDEVLRN